MGEMGDRDLDFVAKRRTLNHRWKVVGWILIALIAAALGFLLFTSPMLVDPWETMARVRTDSIPKPTLQLMAAMLPVVFLSSFLLLTVIVAFQFSAAANERRLIGIIDSLSTPSSLSAHPDFREMDSG